VIDVMVDLETMGTSHTAPIIAIGAVVFGNNATHDNEEFYETISLQSAVDSGAVIQPSTVLWWMQQSDEARAEFQREGLRVVCGSKPVYLQIKNV
jgi:exodeoxyribonuclease VIII